jgi:hypothetical protein
MQTYCRLTNMTFCQLISAFASNPLCTNSWRMAPLVYLAEQAPESMPETDYGILG